MAQPSGQGLFGNGTYYDMQAGYLFIPTSAFTDAGLDAIDDANALPILAALLKKSSSWLQQNQDESVKASSVQSSFSPSTRNGQEVTEYIFTFSFYGDYQAPTFIKHQLLIQMILFSNG